MKFINGLFILGLLLGLESCLKCRIKCIHGVCQNKVCICDLWWAGDDCNKSQFDDFEGEYFGKDDCQKDSVSLVLSIDEIIPHRAWINGNELYFEFTDMVQFDIPEQQYRGVLVGGEGQMLIDAISMKYTEVNAANAKECHLLAHLK